MAILVDAAVHRDVCSYLNRNLLPVSIEDVLAEVLLIASRLTKSSKRMNILVIPYLISNLLNISFKDVLAEVLLVASGLTKSSIRIKVNVTTSLHEAKSGPAHYDTEDGLRGK